MRGVVMTVLSFGLLVSIAQPAVGAQYLRLVGSSSPIKGEVKGEKYRDWIDISAWGIGFATDIYQGGSGAPVTSQPRLTHLDFVMTSSIATPPILEHLFLGQIMPEAELALVRQIGKGDLEYATWEFNTVLVTQWDQSSSGGQPVERFSLLPLQVEYTYFEYDGAGKLLGHRNVSWDFATGKTASSTVGTVENFQFYTGTLVPEPTGISLALLVGGALLNRRRR